jgi:hypothetical protein
VGFDVMAILVAPTLVYAAAKLKPKRAIQSVTRRANRSVRWRTKGELPAAEEPSRGRGLGDLLPNPDANLARQNE